MTGIVSFLLLLHAPIVGAPLEPNERVGAVPGPCGGSSAERSLLGLHEQARHAHLSGDARLLGETMADEIVQAGRGTVSVQKREEVVATFARYFSRVTYRSWSDARPPIIAVSTDGTLAWMAVELKADYVDKAAAEDGPKSFRSSWIATYRADRCRWLMTGISSNVVE